MVHTTKEQRQALKEIWSRTIAYQVIDGDTVVNGRNPLTYRQFRATVIPGLGYIMVPWAGMWLGIEPDGYTHS